MFEAIGGPVPGGVYAAAGLVDAATVRGWQQALSASLEDDTAGIAGVDEAGLVDVIGALEELKCTAEAAQAAAAVALDASQRRAQAVAGVPAARQGRGVAAQVGLARRESHHKGRQHLGLAKILHAEMPHTLAAFRAGLISEWRAVILARETACLPLEHRATVDRALAADGQALSEYGTGELEAAARKLACRLDPAAVAARRRRAESERRVSCRPAPDTMGYLSCLLPVAQAVAVYAALTKHADTLRAGGDPRGRGQVMADTLVERVTGQAAAAGVPVAINLLLTARTLLGSGDGVDEPAYLEGHGPIPADLARDLVARSAWQHQATTWLRRLFTHPVSGDLIGMDSRARAFPRLLAQFIRSRDLGICRTPWCDAPIRHIDHITAVDEGGPTSAVNGQGLCEACNHAKQAPGWTASASSEGSRHTVITSTPTGHTYRSRAPDPPGTPGAVDPLVSSPSRRAQNALLNQREAQNVLLNQRDVQTRLETHFADLVLAT